MIGEDRLVALVALARSYDVPFRFIPHGVQPRSARRWALLPALWRTMSLTAPELPVRGSGERSSAASYLLPVRRG